MANYPTSASSDTNLYLAVNNKRTTLNGAINNSVTTITVASTTGFPTSGFISIDLEVIAYTGTNATQFTGCTRGADGTTAASHADTTQVIHRIVAAHHNAPKDEIIAIETDLVAAHGTLNDVATPAATTTNVKTRLDHIVSELKRITQNTNWYDTVSYGLKDIAGNTFIGSGRNRIINGSMFIDQANGGAAVTVNTSSQFFFVDQFSGTGISSAGVFTAQQLTTTPPTGFTHYLHIACTTADASIASTDLYRISNNIEGNIVRDFMLGTSAAVTFTLSFWVRSTTTGTYTGSFRNANINRSYPFEYSISAANTWEKKSITLTGDTTGTWTIDSTAGLLLEWGLAVGSNFQGTANSWQAGNFAGTSNQVNFMASNTNTWDLTGVQLEIGSTATPFEFRMFPIELQLCQRYYEKSYDPSTAPGTNTSTGRMALAFLKLNTNTMVSHELHFKITKRAVPTVTYYTESGTSGSWDFSNAAGTLTARAVSTNAASLHGTEVAQVVIEHFYGRGQWVADARL